MTDPVAFPHACRWDDVPEAVRHTVRRHLLDTLAVAAAGARTRAGRVMRDHAAAWHGPGTQGGAPLPFDGRRAAIPGAGLAGAGAIDALDAHDGHPLTKGHVGVAAVPAALALSAELAPCSLGELLTRVLVGYELGTRAGIACHRSQPQYHTSGAWNGVAAAAIAARALGLDENATRAALGTAAFYGARGTMMAVIDRPSMLKDGSAAGAFTGLAAALLARDGFTAGDADVLTAPEAAGLWDDLGEHWCVTEHYLKPYPVCRWAQPAIEAAAAMRARVDPARIARVHLATFREAVRLAGARPATSEEAQYAIAFPVAAMLQRGRVGPDEIDGPALTDPAILDMAARIAFTAEPRFDARFPAERWAEMGVETHDGETLSGEPVTARGDADAPLSDGELAAKAHSLLAGTLDAARRDALIDALMTAPPETPAADVLAPIHRHRVDPGGAI